MNKLLMVGLLVSCLVALSLADDRLRFSMEAGRRQDSSGRHDTVKVSQDAWRSKDGRWPAGGYVQHDRHKVGGARFKETHGGFMMRGTF